MIAICSRFCGPGWGGGGVLVVPVRAMDSF